MSAIKCNSSQSVAKSSVFAECAYTRWCKDDPPKNSPGSPPETPKKHPKSTPPGPHPSLIKDSASLQARDTTIFRVFRKRPLAGAFVEKTRFWQFDRARGLGERVFPLRKAKKPPFFEVRLAGTPRKKVCF